MSRTTRRTTAALATIVALIATIMAVSAPWVDADPREITVFEPAGEGYEAWFDISGADTGPGADAGDILMEHKGLVDPESGEPVGTAVTRVQLVDIVEDDPTFIIDCTIQLPDGDLVFYGAGTFGALGDGVTLAVTGGTGAYDRASGTVTVSGNEDGVTIAFSLSKR